MYLLFALLSRLLNRAFRTPISRLIYLASLSLLILIPFSHSLKSLLPVLVFALSLSLILTVTIRRLSNNFIYSHITKHASMIVNNLDSYRSIDYVHESLKIKTLLQKEFKEALIYASTQNVSKIRFSTHKWFVYQVVLQPEIEKLYDIEIKEYGFTQIAMEILILIPISQILRFETGIIETALRKRPGFKVVLTGKH